MLGFANVELEYPMDPEQEQPTISDSDFRSQIIKEREVEVLLLENPIREKTPQGSGDPDRDGGGGDPDNPEGINPGNPVNPPNWVTDKLIGNEPKIFSGERDQVEGFLTSWILYHGLNQ